MRGQRGEEGDGGNADKDDDTVVILEAEISPNNLEIIEKYRLYRWISGGVFAALSVYALRFPLGEAGDVVRAFDTTELQVTAGITLGITLAVPAFISSLLALKNRSQSKALQSLRKTNTRLVDENKELRRRNRALREIESGNND